MYVNANNECYYVMLLCSSEDRADISYIYNTRGIAEREIDNNCPTLSGTCMSGGIR